MKVADTVLLELSGLRAPTRIQSHSVHTVLSAEELEEFKKRGIAAARESGLVIDVPPETKQIGPTEGQATPQFAERKDEDETDGSE